MILAWLASLALLSSSASELTETQRKKKEKLALTRLEGPDYLKAEIRRAWEVHHSFLSEFALVRRDEAMESGEPFDDVLPPGWMITPHWLYYAFVNERRVRELVFTPSQRCDYCMDPADSSPHVVWTGIDATKLHQFRSRSCTSATTVNRGAISRLLPGHLASYSAYNVRAKNDQGRISYTFSIPVDKVNQIRYLNLISSTDPSYYEKTAFEFYKGLPLYHPLVLSAFLMSSDINLRSTNQEIEVSIRSIVMNSLRRIEPEFADSFAGNVFMDLIVQLGLDFSRILDRRMERHWSVALPGSTDSYHELYRHLPNEGRTSITASGQVVLSDHPEALEVQTRNMDDFYPQPVHHLLDTMGDIKNLILGSPPYRHLTRTFRNP